MKTLYVNELRGEIVEARHKVHAIAFQGNSVIFQTGDPSIIVPMRSVAKPFMLSPLLEEAEKQQISLSPEMISIMASSHNGEEEHRNLVEQILSLSGSTVNKLHCGSHMPYYSWLYADYFAEQDLARRQLYHNCSGKHAGMLLLAALMSASKKDYWKTEHPIQRRITGSVQELLGVSKKGPFSIALDGCGVPTYCVELKTIARGFQQLYRNEDLLSVHNAIIEEPFFNSGTERIEMTIIKEFNLLAKSGSSGLFCVADEKNDIGVALKIEDGHDDISEAAIVAVLEHIGLIPTGSSLLRYRELEIKTSTGIMAGKYYPVWES